MLEIRNRFRADPQLGQKMATLLSAAVGNTAHRRPLAALLEAYEGPDSRYLNFYGAAGHVQTIPLHAALDGSWRTELGEPADLSGRIVFVGQSDLLNLHGDGFVTVFSRDDGVDVSGVEIAATAVANLLDGRLIEPAGPGLTYALLVAFGLAIGAVAGAFHAPVAVPVTLFMAGAFYAGAYSGFAQENLWLPVVTPLLVQLPLGLLLGLLLQYRDAHRAKVNISRGMRYYLPAAVASGFAEAALDPARLKERVFAVCMVTDASRFTTLAETMEPGELSEFLDGYFGILFGVVDRYGGLVTDVVGDGMTAVWTAPQPDRGCRLRACLAAVELDRAVSAFNRQHHPRALPTRIGLNAGDAIVGNVGGSGRFAYSVIGDCVNTAARLETLNKQVGTRIIAAHGVIDGLDEIVSRPLGRFQLFGKGDTLAVVEVVGSAADARHVPFAADFAEALDDLEQGRFADAARGFETILAAQPSDGPASFYRKYCKQYLSGTSVPTAHGAIRMETK
jgi:adenylate cyclase